MRVVSYQGEYKGGNSMESPFSVTLNLFAGWSRFFSVFWGCFSNLLSAIGSFHSKDFVKKLQEVGKEVGKLALI